MKTFKPVLILSLLVILIQSGVVTSTLIADPIVVEKPVDVDYVANFNRNEPTTPQTIESISATMAKQAYLEAAKVDTYTLATTFFNSQKYFGDVCSRCKKLEYLSFRQGTYYLTAGISGFTFVASSSSGPTNAQLFIAEQQIDGSWAFRSLTQGKYIRASNDGVTVNLQTFVGPWERWYMERHGNHVHVQSAQFENYYWIGSGLVLRQLNGGASSFIVEHWPSINWLWNW